MATSVRMSDSAKEKFDELHEHINEESRYSISKREILDAIVEDAYEEEINENE